MEGEISNTVMVWSVAAATTCYCHRIGRVIPKGKGRAVAIFPAILVLLLLPLRLTSIHIGGLSSFFLGWLCTFKLLLYAFGKGPLSSTPPLSLSRFVPLSLLPIKFQDHPSPSKSSSASALAAPLSLFALLIPLYGHSHKHPLHPDLLLFLYSLHMYAGLEFAFALVSFFSRKLLLIDLEPQFNRPFLSTSLQDFWGRRWNLMVNRILYPTVYDPVVRASARVAGRKWAPLPAIVATFGVSALMHELVYYYIKREKRTWEPWEPSWDSICFFLLHGVCLAFEVAVKKTLDPKWHLPRLVSWPLTVVFVFYTSFWLFFPALLRCRVYDKAVREWNAFTHFAEHLFAVSRFACFRLTNG